jgi:hypothetical protein
LAHLQMYRITRMVSRVLSTFAHTHTHTYTVPTSNTNAYAKVNFSHTMLYVKCIPDNSLYLYIYIYIYIYIIHTEGNESSNNFSCVFSSSRTHTYKYYTYTRITYTIEVYCIICTREETWYFSRRIFPRMTSFAAIMEPLWRDQGETGAKNKTSNYLPVYLYLRFTTYNHLNAILSPISLPFRPSKFPGTIHRDGNKFIEWDIIFFPFI